GPLREVDESESEVDQQKERQEERHVKDRGDQEEGRAEDQYRSGGRTADEGQPLAGPRAGPEASHCGQLFLCRGEIARPGVGDDGVQIEVSLAEEVAADRRVQDLAHGVTFSGLML